MWVALLREDLVELERYIAVSDRVANTVPWIVSGIAWVILVPHLKIDGTVG